MEWPHKLSYLPKLFVKCCFLLLLFTSWLKRPEAGLISSNHVALPHMTLAAPMFNLASPNLSSQEYSLCLCKTLFGELHLVKLHLGNFIWQNLIWRRLAAQIDYLALPSLTLAMPGVLIFFKRLDRQTYIHTHAQLYYRLYMTFRYSWHFSQQAYLIRANPVHKCSNE